MVSLLALLPTASNTSLSTTYVSSGKGNFGLIISESENSHEHSEPDVNYDSSIYMSTANPFSSSRVVNHANFSGSISMSIAGPSFSSRVVNPIMANLEGDLLNEQSELDAHVIPLSQSRKNPVRNCAPLIKMQDFVTFIARHPIPNSFTYQQLLLAHVISKVHEP